ncbi:meiotically up-regulated 65 protein [Colletotrichum tamarilloi]|uniref:Meiotically up-regulated 65 protein n=1 Tax=Colletotrichum tamarilloi TaxID=1209934 RepID=A0ABQ9RSG4_9PEZI|nr:meiotically up-regulated 65 protein [Colletotrichum tamarilloi]KAK1511944.1 meiotically up-regulated 65 protein [Colletotrichum tamarilloi]
MPSFRSSRRATGLKDSDYDHEISLVNHDNRGSPSTESLSRPPRASTGSQLLRDEDTTGSHDAEPNGDRSTEHDTDQDASRSGRLVEPEQSHLSKAAGHRSAPTLEPQTTTATTAPSIEVEEPTPMEGTMPGRSSSQRRRPATADRETAIDVLWENERGFFVCRVALFSGKALGNLDPSPWTNQFHKTSPTTIKTAQVPDPSWEWAWPEWKIHREEGVAMDEFGWEYSFMFSKRYSWHGPKWWNSFVRRRCWVRKRIKKKPEDISEDPHMLNSDYFTVTPANHSRSSSVARSRRESVSKASVQTSVTEEKQDIEDVWTLMAVLRGSRIDREKIEAFENYLAHAKDNLEHLQEEMHDVMGIFVFQASRRLLLSRLTQIYDEAVAADEEKHEDADKAKEREERRKHLAAAIKHADEEVKRLSYWSDVKRLAENGEAKHAVAEDEGWNKGWEGVDQSGPAQPNSGALPATDAARPSAVETPTPRSRIEDEEANHGTNPTCDTAVSPTLEGPAVEDEKIKTSLRVEDLTLGDGPDTKPKEARKPTTLHPLDTISERRKPFEHLLKDASERKFKRPNKTGSTQVQHDSILVTPTIRYQPQRESRASVQRFHQSITRQIWLETVRQVKKGSFSNWRNTLDLLRRQTRPVKGPWQRNVRDEDALEHASQEISRLAARADSTISIEGAIGSNFSTTRRDEVAGAKNETVWKSSEEEQRPAYMKEYSHKHKYESIPKPKEWTPDSFLAYITAITNARITTHDKYKMYGAGPAADNAALKLLFSAFTDESSRHARSRRAFKQALRFIELRGNAYRNHARDLFQSQRDAPFSMDTGVFNIMLENCAKLKDLRNFHGVLGMMISYGCQPNAKTWALYMEMIESKQIIQHVLRLMHSLGLLLDPGVVPLVTKQLVTEDMRKLEHNWPGIRSFLETLTAKYGTGWSSRPVMHAIMNELGRMGNFASCCDLWDIMAESRNTFPTTLTLNTMLQHAKTQRHLIFATAALEKAHKHFVVMNEQSYHILFFLAFRLDRPNAMGIIWRYACVAGRTSSDMRNQISNWRYGVNPENVLQHAIEPNPKAHAAPSALPTWFDQDVTGANQVNGARISKATHEYFREHKMRPWYPLHQLLSWAWEADGKIIAAVRKAKQQSLQHSPPTPLRTVTTPGIMVMYQRNGRGLRTHHMQLKIEHVAATDDLPPSSVDGDDQISSSSSVNEDKTTIVVPTEGITIPVMKDGQPSSSVDTDNQPSPSVDNYKTTIVPTDALRIPATQGV